jgi:hypothetical protein
VKEGFIDLGASISHYPRGPNINALSNHAPYEGSKATFNGGFHLIVSKNACHLKCFKIINETIPKMHDFILEFYNTKFYVVTLVVYKMK